MLIVGILEGRIGWMATLIIGSWPAILRSPLSKWLAERVCVALERVPSFLLLSFGEGVRDGPESLEVRL